MKLIQAYIIPILLSITFPCFAAEKYLLAVDEWDRPLDANAVSIIKPLPEVIAKWSGQANQKIDIRYPGGEMGGLLASRLRDWLVVLGVPSSDIILTPGSAAVTQLELVVQ